MGRAWGFWVPLAALGFAELILAAVQLATAEHGAQGDLHADPVHRVPGGLLGPDPGPGGLQFLTQDQVPLPPSTYATALGWPIALAVVVALVLAGYVRAGKAPSTGRFAALVAGGVLAVPVLDLAAFGWLGLGADLRGPALATLGLVVLAWYERSVVVLVVAVVFALVAAVVLPGLGGVVLSAAILLATAFAVVAGPAKWRSRPAAATG
ncbi:hypothetical protein [Amycolatopsis sp. NPDC001319]|uniref:hypothetical protein n=1 Tax=unclassified Amycolatopsis TaxID=2618356 RepID=UPI0036B5512D